MSHKPILILGVQRSGTTLLTRMLSANDNLYIQNELPLQQIFPNANSFEQLNCRLKKEIKTKSNVDIDELSQQTSFHWGVKDPQLLEHIDVIEQFSKDFKFLIIIRDCRGTVNSILDNKWGQGTNPYTAAQKWKNEVSQQIEFANRHQDICQIVKYEDLICQAQQEIAKVCQFLEIPFDESMINYHQKKAGFTIRPQNVNTNRMPNINIATKWQRELSHSQISIVENVAGELLKSLGYELIGAPVKIGLLKKLYYLTHQKVLGELQLQYQLKKHYLNKLTFRTK